MKKKWLITTAMVLGILLATILLANFGLHLWLKNKLPSWLKENTEYIVTYKSLEVDLGTGNIFATGITINNKQPDNTAILGLQGTVDTLKASRFGILDLLLRNKISTSDLYLAKPNVTVKLPEIKKNKTEKKQNPLAFKKLHIRNGNISVFKTASRKFFSVKNMNLEVKNLQLTEQSIENTLPVVFEDYSITGDSFFLRPTAAYAITTAQIRMETDEMKIRDFRVIPLLRPQQFAHYYPKSKNMVGFSAAEISFKKMMLQKKKLTLDEVVFQNSKLTLYTSEAKTQKKVPAKNDFTVNLANLNLKNTEVTIQKLSGPSVFSGKNINVNVTALQYDPETAQEKIPFTYQDFKVSGQQLSLFAGHQNIVIASVALNPHGGELRHLSATPLYHSKQKASFALKGNLIQFKINSFGLKEKKLNVDIDHILLDQIKGSITAASHPQQKKSDFSGIQFPIPIRSVTLKNSDITYDKGKQPLAFHQVNAELSNIKIQSKNNSELYFDLGNYSAATKNFHYQTQFYNLTADAVKLAKNGAEITQFRMVPRVSRSQFIRMIPVEKDLYNLKAASISLKGKWDLFSKNKYLEASDVVINSANATIFRSKIPKDDPREKPLYSALLRKIKFPLFIHNLAVKNSYLEYEEDTKKSDGPGKLTFSQFNMKVQNLNSGKMKGKPTEVPITIDCRFFEVSPMHVKWSFNTANMADAFKISGNISSLPAPRINAFVEPYLKIRTTGSIQNLDFNFLGNRKGLDGAFKMHHKDLKVSILKEGGEKNKVLSAVANIFVKSNSGKFPESVVVDDVARDPTKSFFNLFWRGIEEGLKKTLIGANVEKTEAQVKNTVQGVKTASADVKTQISDAKTTVKDVKTTVKDASKELQRGVQEITGKDSDKKIKKKTKKSKKENAAK